MVVAGIRIVAVVVLVVVFLVLTILSHHGLLTAAKLSFAALALPTHHGLDVTHMILIVR